MHIEDKVSCSWTNSVKNDVESAWMGGTFVKIVIAFPFLICGKMAGFLFDKSKRRSISTRSQIKPFNKI